MKQIIGQSPACAKGVLRVAESVQKQHEATTPIQRRKEYGQFFTPISIARFMAGLFSSPSGELRILDAGAGTGTLTAAVCDRILRLRSPRTVKAVLFETDSRVLPLLEKNMRSCCRLLQQAGHSMAYAIEHKDFVLDNQEYLGQRSLFSDNLQLGSFDAIIMNPPYFKINKASPHAMAFEQVFRSQPNIYALFMATACTQLRPGGELVAITPRSFCNGLYFREFRRWFLSRMSLRHIHLFDSRTATFKDDNVLQESLITSWTLGAATPKVVQLTTSHGADFSDACRSNSYSYDRIIDDCQGNLIVRIPASPADAAIMEAVDSWPKRFTDCGLRISTGPVVVFRATKHLLQQIEPNAVPLLFPHNVRAFETQWPLRKNGKPVAIRSCASSENLLIPTKNYVLLKRFSAKEEHRRLTASCFIPSRGDWPTRVGVENHVNYIYHARRELTEPEVFGLAALLNSTLLDRYFRTLSGNTQVNATEIRAMPFPSLEIIARLGSAVARLNDNTRDALDSLVLRSLGIDGCLARRLTGASS